MSTHPAQTDRRHYPNLDILTTYIDGKMKIVTTYIDGKMKRYNLLFAVNGGAFIVAKLIHESDDRIGHLTLTTLAVGAILFTALMTLDICLWGRHLNMQYRMYVRYVDRKEKDLVFTGPGQFILGALFVLLEAAWILAIW